MEKAAVTVEEASIAEEAGVTVEEATIMGKRSAAPTWAAPTPAADCNPGRSIVRRWAPITAKGVIICASGRRAHTTSWARRPRRMPPRPASLEVRPRRIRARRLQQRWLVAANGYTRIGDDYAPKSSPVVTAHYRSQPHSGQNDKYVSRSPQGLTRKHTPVATVERTTGPMFQGPPQTDKSRD